jgi:peptidoglycan/LPS O-acetylase OafA/YrhL
MLVVWVFGSFLNVFSISYSSRIGSVIIVLTTLALSLCLKWTAGRVVEEWRNRIKLGEKLKVVKG